MKAATTIRATTIRAAAIRAAAIWAAAMLAGPVIASAQSTFQPPPDAIQTPSGNVHCLLRGDLLRCDVLEHFYETPPRPPQCEGDWGGRLGLGAEGEPSLLCTTGTVRNDEAFVLGYGARWLIGRFICESEEAGLRCANPSGHGFQVSRSVLRLF